MWRSSGYVSNANWRNLFLPDDMTKCCPSDRRDSGPTSGFQGSSLQDWENFLLATIDFASFLILSKEFNGKYWVILFITSVWYLKTKVSNQHELWYFHINSLRGFYSNWSGPPNLWNRDFYRTISKFANTWIASWYTSIYNLKITQL